MNRSKLTVTLCEVSFKETHILTTLTILPQLVKPFGLVNLDLSLALAEPQNFNVYF